MKGALPLVSVLTFFISLFCVVLVAMLWLEFSCVPKGSIVIGDLVLRAKCWESGTIKRRPTGSLMSLGMCPGRDHGTPVSLGLPV
jgi:hypothetical protein